MGLKLHKNMNANNQNEPKINAENHLKVDILDVVFDGRNKAYGAYDLRKTYNERIKHAAFAAFFAVSALVAVPFISSALHRVKKYEGKDVVLIDYTPPPPETDMPPLPPPPPPPPPPPVTPPPQVATIKFLPPVPVPDDKAPENPPKIEDMDGKVIGKENLNGEKGSNAKAVAEPAQGKAMPTIVEEAPKPKEVEEPPMLVVEKRAEFPGGDKALLAFLAENITYPQMARENGIEGKVFLQFVVERDGGISGVKIMRPVGGGCSEEAVRVINLLPKFAPAKQNGHTVRMIFNLPVVFKLNE